MMKTTSNIVTKKKETGRIYTPLYIVENILDLSGYCGNTILKKHVIDNSCGDGAFLCEIVRRYCYEALKVNMPLAELASDLETYIHGIEIDVHERNKCIENINTVISRFEIVNINWDVLCDDALSNHKYDGKMDYVLGNPPYVRVHNLGEKFNSIKNFYFSQEGMTDLFIVFYEIGIRMLSETGILGYITPSSFFNSLAGTTMRKELINKKLLAKVVDLKHYQAFDATAYTTIIILDKSKANYDIDYYQFDEKNKIPYYVDTLNVNDFYISGKYHFAKKEDLVAISKIYSNYGKSDIMVKNGYATLCDKVFINDFDFDSKFIIPVIKASKGIKTKIFFPYTDDGFLLSEDEIKSDVNMYAYLLEHKERLLQRSNEKDNNKYWYAFGRSQAINDTFKDKLAINSLIRDENDFKFVDAPAGTGIYSGLYIISETIPITEIKKALNSKEFISYVSLLGKYKSGRYYTFSSKDVKLYLDYKFAYDGGILSCLQMNNF